MSFADADSAVAVAVDADNNVADYDDDDDDDATDIDSDIDGGASMEADVVVAAPLPLASTAAAAFDFAVAPVAGAAAATAAATARARGTEAEAAAVAASLDLPPWRRPRDAFAGVDDDAVVADDDYSDTEIAVPTPPKAAAAWRAPKRQRVVSTPATAATASTAAVQSPSSPCIAADRGEGVADTDDNDDDNGGGCIWSLSTAPLLAAMTAAAAVTETETAAAAPLLAATPTAAMAAAPADDCLVGGGGGGIGAGFVEPPTPALRVPRPGDDATPLSAAHPIDVFDRCVAFREYPDHRYFVFANGYDAQRDDAAALWPAAAAGRYELLDGSGTGFLESFRREHFDGPAVAARIVVNPRSDYFGRTVESVLAQWERAQQDGTALHLECERFYNGLPPADAAVRAWPEWQYFLRFHAEFAAARGLAPMRTELTVYLPEARLAGQVDMLYWPPGGGPAAVRADGTVAVEMYDWKRTKEISDYCYGAPKYYLPPLAHVRDTKRQFYRYQLALYATILHRTTHYRVVRAGIVRFHPTAANYELIDVDLDPAHTSLMADVGAMLQTRIDAIAAGVAPPPLPLVDPADLV